MEYFTQRFAFYSFLGPYETQTSKNWWCGHIWKSPHEFLVSVWHLTPLVVLWENKEFKVRLGCILVHIPFVYSLQSVWRRCVVLKCLGVCVVSVLCECFEKEKYLSILMPPFCGKKYCNYQAGDLTGLFTAITNHKSSPTEGSYLLFWDLDPMPLRTKGQWQHIRLSAWRPLLW